MLVIVFLKEVRGNTLATLILLKEIMIVILNIEIS